MTRRKRKVFKIIGWIVLGFVSLILLVTLGFYLGRGWIMNRAVSYLNEQQPGEVQMGKMNLIPFMNFPDVSLQLRNVSYYEKEVKQDSLLQEPIISLNEVFVTLDVVDLIRGELQVSQARMEDGFVRMEIYEDSISNLEYALGIRFRQETKKDTTAELPGLSIDMERIELSNVLLLLNDRTRDDHVNVTVNRLESNFSYLSDHLETGLKLDIDVNDLKYLTYRSESRRNILFESDVIVNTELKEIHVEPSSLKISDLELETWGTYSFLNEPHVDFAFKASNKGLEVLNYLFRGVLDLDEIEQIGSGSIYLSGNINGYLGDQLPVIHLNGSADKIGFRIKSIGKDVTDISFSAYATNGTKLDYSEGLLQVEGFTATFPEGIINCNISAKNIKTPEVKIELEGDVNLAGLDQMFNTDLLRDLEGFVAIDGNLSGVINKNTGEFLNDAGSLVVALNEVGFVLNKDSVYQDSLQRINGEVFIQEHIIGTKDLTFEFNGNVLSLGARIENLILYMLGYNRDVKAEISLTSNSLIPSSIIRDTTVAGLLGNELRGLHFGAGGQIAKQDLDAFFKDDSIPKVELTLDSFGIELPVYADISNMNASVTLAPDTLILHHLNGTVGESEVDFSGLVTNYRALGGGDSSAVVEVSFQASSDRMRAEDFFTFNEDFKLPETYRTEYLEEFHLSGSLQLPVNGLLYDSVSLDFGLGITDLGWNFRYYPLKFEQFLVQVRRRGDMLFIDNFQGKIGDSNLKMTASLGNFTDTLSQNLYGNLVLESDLLDFNELLNYQLPEDLKDHVIVDSSEVREPPRLDQIEYPRFDFTVDIGELHYGENKIFGMKGRLRSSREKIFYLDQLVTSGESGGTMEFNGQFNVSNPWLYNLSAEFDLKDVNINDLDFEMQSGEESYTLKENFQGLVSAEGIAEIFITPDLKFDISNTTANFNVKVSDGALINFTPLQAAAKYLDNTDLNHIKFATLYNQNFTLIDSKIIIPLMNVESTAGQLLIEGEQGLDNSYLYLIRVPPRFAMAAAKSVLTGEDNQEDEDQIQEMKSGKFLVLTAWGKGGEEGESEVKLGDKRDKYE